jgi:ADP-ribose pyrophosphatase
MKKSKINLTDKKHYMASIPKNAKKVFEWILFDVYHFEVTWVDWNPKIFERVRWYDVVRAICIVDWKIIVTDEVHPDHSKISLPWWMTHKGEDPLDAIQREVKEETWYTFKDWKLIKQFSLGKSNIEMYRYYYLAQHILGQ